MLGEDSVVATIARASGGETGDIAKQAAADVLTGRFIHLEEVADLIVLLASDRAGNVTKADVTIDGFQHMCSFIMPAKLYTYVSNEVAATSG